MERRGADRIRVQNTGQSAKLFGGVGTVYCGVHEKELGKGGRYRCFTVHLSSYHYSGFVWGGVGETERLSGDDLLYLCVTRAKSSYYKILCKASF